MGDAQGGATMEGEHRISIEEIRIPTNRQNIRNNTLALFYHQVLPLPDNLRVELNSISQDGNRSFSEVFADKKSRDRLMQAFHRFERDNPEIEKIGRWYDLDIVSAIGQFLHAKKEGKVSTEETRALLGETTAPDANIDTVLSSFQERGLPLEGLRTLFGSSIVDPRSQIEQERQSGNAKVQGVIEAVANSVDAIQGSKDTIIHELAHALEARMEGRAWIGHDISFTHQQHGKFAETMRFVAQLALRQAV